MLRVDTSALVRVICSLMLPPPYSDVNVSIPPEGYVGFSLGLTKLPQNYRGGTHVKCTCDLGINDNRQA